MKKFYKNKKILITGGTGMIGVQLTNYLIDYGAKVTVISLDKNIKFNRNVKFINADLRERSTCKKIFKKIDFVFHLAGVKGSPLMALKRPYKFMTPMLMFNANVLDAAQSAGVKRFLYTSSVGVYNQKGIMKEEDLWKTFPSRNDWYAGWAKRIGELNLEALVNSGSKMKTTIVRPANVFGPFDNFDDKTGMVIPSLIKKFYSNAKKINVWGDGTNLRDFIYSKDVARAMLHVMYKSPNQPINLGSGTGISIKNLVTKINKIFQNEKKVFWDKSKVGGDKVRILDVKRLKKIGFKHKYSFDEALLETIKWYKSNSKIKLSKYNAFNEK